MEFKVGDWIIWEGDSYPHPRKILDMTHLKYICSIKQLTDKEYKPHQWNDLVLLKKSQTVQMARNTRRI